MANIFEKRVNKVLLKYEPKIRKLINESNLANAEIKDIFADIASTNFSLNQLFEELDQVKDKDEKTYIESEIKRLEDKKNKLDRKLIIAGAKAYVKKEIKKQVKKKIALFFASNPIVAFFLVVSCCLVIAIFGVIIYANKVSPVNLIENGKFIEANVPGNTKEDKLECLISTAFAARGSGTSSCSL
ncbi:hypothetical protein KC669_02440 [Candidatus Dojkabacteria bacterium]|uniref:Uncharacterized protein n=1 Tax=Candidatus Dojkabacteria bacterium TaxID=2099670 RepID=A0A955LAW9_9BACT|nr:hypothetical protein [Candidatus Dojkabacteria bacterium]